MVSFVYRCVSVFVLFVLCSSVLTGCGDGREEGGSPLDPVQTDCREAKLFVMALDYILRSSETKRIDSAFNDLSGCLEESRRPDWGSHADSMGKLSVLSGEVKALLKKKPPKLAEARPKVDEMMKLAETLPGDDVRLEERWVNLQQL